VAPVQRRSEGLLAWRRCAPSRPRQGELRRQQVGHLLDAERLDTACCKFDRQRDAIQIAADGGGGRRLLVAEFEPGEAGRGAFHEELYRRIGQGLSRRQLGVRGWRRERRDPVDALAVRPQGLPTGRQHPHARRRRDQRLGYLRSRIDDPFARVEHHERLACLKTSERAGQRVGSLRRHAKHRAKRLGDAVLALGRNIAEVDEHGQIAVCRRPSMRGGQRDGGLADSPRPHHRHKSLQLQLAQQRLDGGVAPDHPRRSGGQRSGSEVGHADAALGRGGFELERGDEAVAAAWHGRDATGAPFAFAQRTAQANDVKAQSGVDDDGVWPDPIQQLTLRDHLARPLGQRRQDVGRPAGEFDRHASALEPPLGGGELERAETDAWPRRRRRVHRSVKPVGPCRASPAAATRFPSDH
jgi:hypothetical protein